MQGKGYIPLWSNQAIEYWFLLHFNHIDSHMDRTLYQSKLNEYFKKAKLEYKYKKNDKTIYSKLIKYGSLEEAKIERVIYILRIEKIHLQILKVVQQYINSLMK